MFDRLATRIRRLAGRVLPGDPLFRSFAGGATWSLLGSGAARGLTLIASIIIARGLGKEAFGGWALILTTVGTFSLVATMGLGVSLTKHIAESYRTSPERAGAVLSLVISVASITVGLASIVCWYSSSWLANVFFATPLLEQPLRWTALLIFFAVFSQLMQASLLGFSAFRAIAVVQFVHSICVVLLAYPLTKAFGLTGGVIAATTGAFAGVIVATTTTVILWRRHGLRINLRETLEARSILHRFALPAFLADAISVGALTTSQALVARIPGGLSGLGSYQAAVNLRDVVLFVPGAIRRVTLPMLSELKEQDSVSRYRWAVSLNLRVNVGAALLGAIVIMAISPWLLDLYGPGFRKDWDIVVILLVAAVVQSLRDVLMHVTLSLSSPWHNFAAASVWSTIMVVGTRLCLPQWGIRGFAATYCCAAIASTLVYVLAVRSLMRQFEREST